MWSLICDRSCDVKEVDWRVTDVSNRHILYVPEGCGRGFLTLEDETEVFYQMSEFYHPELTRSMRWDDPACQIAWPDKVEGISERDRTYPNFESMQCAC